MRTFTISKHVTRGRQALVIRDEDNQRHRLVEGPSMKLCKLLVVAAIRQLLAKEERPMPDCPVCGGCGIYRKEDGSHAVCENDDCQEWYEGALSICDRVKVTVNCPEEVGEIEL